MMPKTRRKTSAIIRDFSQEISRLKKIDSDNQSRYSVNPKGFSRHRLHLITESLFFRAYRAYENAIRDLFLLYCLEKRPKTNKQVVSYLNPSDFSHAEELIKSSQKFLNWANPEEIINRANLYLKDGYPIKIPLSTNKELLLDIKRIRNFIAHDSNEALEQYKKVLRRHFGTVPLQVPTPGQFLLLQSKSDPKKYYLQLYFDILKTIIQDSS